MLEKILFWLKTEDSLYSFFIMKRLLRWVIFSRVWERKGLSAIKKLLTSWDIVNYHVISADPLIIIDVWQHWSFRNLFDYIPKNLKTYFLCLNWWHLENETDVKDIKGKYTEHRFHYPQHEIIYLCNCPRQYDLFTRYQLPCWFCHQNAFLDENMHKFIPECSKIYDAIYVAVGVPAKRHYLASEVNNLALITYFAHFTKQKYIDQIKKELAHAHWLIEPTPLKGYISRSQMHRYLNQAKVGLCLSAAEGAMYASTEYLLCGLPVVSTRSIGGRDMFFDKEYVKIVDDDPAAVREGVAEMIKRNIPGTYIRQKTIAKMQEHRERFLNLLEEISAGAVGKHNFRKLWKNIFTNKMLSSRRMRYIRNDIISLHHSNKGTCLG